MTFPPTHILVPVDVDPLADKQLADRLVDDATSFAKALGAKLTLVYIAVPTVTPMLLTADATAEAYRAMSDVLVARNTAAQRRLKELEERARSTGVAPRTEFISRAGTVPELINEIATEIEADLILLSTHARKGVKRLFLGSVAERTAHLARVPVMLIPPRV